MYKVLIIGITGMLGSTLLRKLALNAEIELYGTSRMINPIEIHKETRYTHLEEVDVMKPEKLFNHVLKIKPDVIINCAGVIKQLKFLQNPLNILPINSLFPHKLEELCIQNEIRLIQISTDCVFSGKKGNYTEADISDAEDLYGKSKYIGEVYGKGSLTIRTSIIGHEHNSQHSLLEWFLSQKSHIEGYQNAIFSGLTTLELSKVIEEVILKFKNLTGLYQVSSEPISKYALLKLIKEVYKKDIQIIPSDKVVINRSLNCKKFQKETGIKIPNWNSMIKSMHSFN
jgi:dTDP-4-dehydrorhamnose reductase